jgi:hypothetical protein
MKNTLSIPATTVVMGLPEIEAMEGEATALLASLPTITTTEVCLTHRELMGDCTSILKQIEEQREAAKRPYFTVGKQIDALAKKTAAPWEKMVSDIKLKLTVYANVVEQERYQAALAQQRIEAENAKLAAENGDTRVPVLVTQVEIPEEAAVITTTITDYIVDLEKLPKEYMIPDEKKIKAAVKAEIDIPGVTITKRKVVVAR